MVHVTEEIYEKLADAIMDGFNGWWDYGEFSADVSCSIEYEKYYTGVEFMGDREVWEVPVYEWEVKSVVFGEDLEATDFDSEILEKYIK